LLILAFGASGIPFSIPNFGFEGAKSNFYGAYFPSSSVWSGYQGINLLHKYQDAEPYLVKSSGTEGAATIIKTVGWTNIATPNYAGMNFEWRKKYALGGSDEVTRKPDLGIEVQSNIALSDINRQGDPLNWNVTDPMNVQRLTMYTKRLVKVAETETTVTYSYNYTGQEFLFIPTEFWVGFSLAASQTDASTGSGWREGEWQNIVCWFRLDFNVWDNAYKDPWLDDPNTNIFDSKYNGTVSAEQHLYEYRGGFPIQGWIQGWNKAGWTSSGTDDQGDPVWFDLKGKTQGTYTSQQLAQIKEKLMSKVAFAPDLIGQFISLYDSPDSQFSYELPENLEPNLIQSPDSSMKKVMYFPINIVNFGTVTEGDFWNGYTVYYPSAYFRVRMIYGVYGKFTYLWTEEVTKPVDQGGLDYPNETEQHGTTVINTPGVGSYFTGISDWFSNPIVLFIIIAIVIIIILVLVLPWFGIILISSTGRR